MFIFRFVAKDELGSIKIPVDALERIYISPEPLISTLALSVTTNGAAFPSIADSSQTFPDKLTSNVLFLKIRRRSLIFDKST